MIDWFGNNLFGKINLITSIHSGCSSIFVLIPLAIKFRLVNADGNSGGHYTQTQIVTSNRTYTTISGTDLTYEGQNTTVIADMDASDTALVRLTSSNDSDFAIGAGSGETSFFGCLLA